MPDMWYIRSAMTITTLTVPTVAKMIGVHHNSVRRWVEDGSLKGYRAGDFKNWRVYREDLDEFCKRSGFRIVNEDPSD